MSTLFAYLDSNKIRQADFAERVGTTQGLISRLVGGRAKPSLDLAVRIQRATDGQVRADAWVSLAPTPSEDAA